MTEPAPPSLDRPITSALEELAEAADRTARDQQLLARRARGMVRQRRRGWAWSKIVDNELKPGTVELLSASVRRLVAVGRRFRPALGRALAAEGHSTRQIARYFGVTHQRVSAMLKPRSP